MEASRVLGKDWKPLIAELVVFVQGGPTAPSGLEQRNNALSA